MTTNAKPRPEDVDLSDKPPSEALPAAHELSDAPPEKQAPTKYRNGWMPEFLQHQLFDDTDARAGVLGFADKASLGYSDEIGGAAASTLVGDGIKLGKALDPKPGDSPEVLKLKAEMRAEEEGQQSTYRKTTDALREQDEAAHKNHKKPYNVGSGLGIAANAILTAPLTGGAGLAKGGAQLTGRALANETAKQGMKFGAVGGLGTSKAGLTSGKASDYAQAAFDTAAGAVSGAAIGYVAPSAIKGVVFMGKAGIDGVKSLYQAVKAGVVRPNDAAKFLAESGVDNLTLGQLNPHSWVNEMEQAAQHSPIGGDTIKAQRAASGGKLETAMMNETLPEGAKKLDLGANIGKQAKMRHVAEAHDTNYGALEGHRIDPELHVGEGQWQPMADLPTVTQTSNTRPDAFGLVTKPSQRVPATDATRKKAADFLEQQATKLPKNKTGDGKVAAGTLHSIRSDLRREAREAMEGMPTSEDRAFAKMMKEAGAGVTDRLEKGLPPDVAAGVRASDAKYGDFIKMLKATAKSKDAPHVSPAKVSEEFKTGANLRDYVLGDKNKLRQLAEAGRNLDVTVPKTGFMDHVMHSPPGKYLGGVLMSKANADPAWRAAFQGKAPWQSKLSAFDEMIGSKLKGPSAKLDAAKEFLGKKLSVSPEGLLSRAAIQEGSAADSDVVPNWMSLGIEKTLEEKIEEQRKEEESKEERRRR
jgi:hypothetical protein